jgi:hypothetical protein
MRARRRTKKHRAEPGCVKRVAGPPGCIHPGPVIVPIVDPKRHYHLFPVP